MAKAAEIPDKDKGQEERVPFGGNPKFFLRLLAASKAPRMAFYAIGLCIIAWWTQNPALLSIFGLLLQIGQALVGVDDVAEQLIDPGDCRHTACAERCDADVETGDRRQAAIGGILSAAHRALEIGSA